jgi:hypothetical protein
MQLTIKEASKLTGKHPDTIRRLLKDNQAHKSIGRGGKVLVDREWLLLHFKPAQTPDTEAEVIIDNTPTPEPTQQDTVQSLISSLQQQLDAKDQQINSLLENQKLYAEQTTKLQDQYQQLLARQLHTGTTELAEAEVMQTEVIVPNSKPKPASKAKPRKTKAKPKKPASKAQAKQKQQPKNKKWWQR